MPYALRPFTVTVTVTLNSTVTVTPTFTATLSPTSILREQRAVHVLMPPVAELTCNACDVACIPA